MSQFLFEGFLLGIAYASPIGVQNIFVISNALQNGMYKSLVTSVIVALMDISLAIACILGLGHFLEQYLLLKFIITLIGSIYLLSVSWQLIKEIRSTKDLNTILTLDFNFWKICQRAFLLTWLNPHALLDGTTILGSYASGLTLSNRVIFCIGVACASLFWFLSLSLIAAIISESGKSAKYLKFIKLLSAITIAFFAIKMLMKLEY